MQNLKNLQVPGSTIAARGLAVNQSLGGEKIVLYIKCFVYSLLLILVVFSLLPYETVLISTHEFPLLSILLPTPLRGRGGVGEQLSGAESPAARLNHDRATA